MKNTEHERYRELIEKPDLTESETVELGQLEMRREEDQETYRKEMDDTYSSIGRDENSALRDECSSLGLLEIRRTDKAA